jgi:hypothetical protein
MKKLFKILLLHNPHAPCLQLNIDLWHLGKIDQSLELLVEWAIEIFRGKHLLVLPF